MLPPEEITAWWVAIVAGVVVVLAVAALLTLLVRFVTVIDRRVSEIRDTLSAITTNTDATSLIDPTGDAVDRVLAEGLQHHLFLGRAYGAIPTPAASTASSNGGAS